MGLPLPPRIFTKILKPVFKVLRQKGFLLSSYTDDCYLQDDTCTFEECAENVTQIVSLLENLGVYIYREKSILILSQILTYLGFVLNSTTMTVQLTP